MKLYPKSFVIAFAEHYMKKQPFMRDPLDDEFSKFEEQYYRELPENFDLTGLISKACKIIGITEDEYNSKYRYNNIPLVRQIVCMVLSDAGATSRQIAELTGFTKPRVINSIRALRVKLKTNKELRDKIDKLNSEL